MANDSILIALAAGLVGYGLWKRSQQVTLVPVPITEQTTPGNPGIVETRYPIAPKPKPVPTTILPLLTETAVRDAAGAWRRTHDVNSVDQMTTLLRSMAWRAQQSVMPPEFYWPWVVSELAVYGAAARNVTLAQMMARNLGPKA